MLKTTATRTHGTVKWFSDKKGIGFILANGVDHFVHYSQIDMAGYKTLHDGDEVTFIAVDIGKGPAAHNVRVVGGRYWE